MAAALLLLLAAGATHGNKPTQTRVLNFAQTPVVIDQPGHYVLNRNWRVDTGALRPIMRISAADVHVDLRGYEIAFNTPGIFIEANNVTVRNGRLSGTDFSLLTSDGRGTIVEDIVGLAGTDGISLRGANSVARNIVTQNSFVELRGPNSLLDSSSIRCRLVCASLGQQSRVTNSQLRSSQAITVRLQGDGNILANNTISASVTSEPPLVVAGDGNVVLNNVFLNPEAEATTVMVVEGSGNVLRDNLAPPIAGRWSIGILFEQGVNFYGNNQMAADTPFLLRAGDQTDWGGNFGY
jgi:hypothetical protein